MKKRLFSGVQPSGQLHIGNYIGAIKQFVNLQNEYESVFCVVDYHAITVPQDPAELKSNIYSITNAYLAAGIDPKKSIIFVQSDVPAHTELGWILNNFVQFGEASRMTQFKEKSQKLYSENSKYYDVELKDERDHHEMKKKQSEVLKLVASNGNLGLFNYPVLMAADILLYDSATVPVSEDQKQHIELTRDIAERFNKRFGKTFLLPEPRIGSLIKSLTDPTKKMSKSDGNQNGCIYLSDTPEAVTKKISRAVTDSEGKYSKSELGVTNLLNIYAALSDLSYEEARNKFLEESYKFFKESVTFEINNFLEMFQDKIKELEEDPEYTKRILDEGAEKARSVASKKLKEVKVKIGVGS